jgi:hypothetical protein
MTTVVVFSGKTWSPSAGAFKKQTAAVMGLADGDVVVDTFDAETGAVTFRFVGAKGAAAETELKVMSPAQAGAKLQITGFAAREEQVATTSPSDGGGSAAADDMSEEATVAIAVMGVVVVLAIVVAVVHRVRATRKRTALADATAPVSDALLAPEMGDIVGDDHFDPELPGVDDSYDDI